MSLSIKNLNRQVIKAEYAVRGALAVRAGVLESELKAGKKHPFERVISCNIGNPQALEQKPLSFPRKVLALLSCPDLLEDPNVGTLFAPDAVARAKSMYAQMNNSSGAYTHSGGYMFIRETVAKFCEERDNRNSGKQLGAADPNNVWLTNGASPAVQMSLQMLINGPEDGILLPIPQYPLYSATISLLNGTAVPYYLDEGKSWSASIEALEKSHADAVAKGVTPRAMAVINPGNPTGQVLDMDAMRTIVDFCHKKKLMILADEVYQENIYAAGKQFHSFREVVLSMGEPYATEVMLMSMHTTSKGIYGECGRRGGYLQTLNFPADCHEHFTKLPSMNLCPNIGGQFMVDLMLKQPKEGDASYAQHQQEYTAIFDSLKGRAKSLATELNTIPGVECNDVEGAMYAFPTLKLPAKFVEKANNAKTAPDMMWAMGLLNAKGVVVVPGSAFGQVDGTLHFRTTILPPSHHMKTVTQGIADYQKAVIAEYK
jgi:alanine transaminase